MHWLVFLAAVPSFLFAASAVPVVRAFAARSGFVAKPHAERFHRHATPLGGGLAIWLSVVATFAVLQLAIEALNCGWIPSSLVPEIVTDHVPGLSNTSGRLWTLLASATAIMFVGLADDRGGLDWRVRLIAQSAVAVFIVWQGWRLTLFIDEPLVTYPLSVLWIVGIVNAFNLLDNMDGLASGVAWIATVLLATVMLMGPNAEPEGPQLFVAGFLAVLAGAIGGFWIYNKPPASIFMGDAGSYFIGFCIATATMMATFAGNQLPRHAVLAPLCILAVPIYDTMSVIVIRLREGRSPFVGDKRHFSHRLVELGLSPSAAVATIYLLTLSCGLGALLLHQVNMQGAIVILLMIASVMAVIAVLEAAARKRK
jgi:UDP-GlcNAc:undecaprenyl-phosphate GlcNAc-1-phosphate transferase